MKERSIPVTVLVQTKNEEKAIEDCLSHLGEFEQVIVVDSISDDATAELAERAGAEVVNFSWNFQYPKKKQWQLDNVATRNEWVFFLDADERPTPELKTEIAHRLRRDGSTFSAFDVRLNYWFNGRRLRHGHRVIKRSLVRKHFVSYPVVDDLGVPGMGELEGHYQPAAKGTVGTLAARLDHQDLDPISSWFERHNRYSDWEAHLRARRSVRLEARGNKTLQGRIFDRIPGKPVFFFAYCYLFRLGFLDGRTGLDYALALASYYWQIDLKLRELERGGSRTVRRAH